MPVVWKEPAFTECFFLANKTQESQVWGLPITSLTACSSGAFWMLAGGAVVGSSQWLPASSGVNLKILVDLV